MEFFQANTAAKDAKGAAGVSRHVPRGHEQEVGVIGFCMGGFLALLVGSVAPDKVAAVVDCYGVGQRMPDLKPLRGIPVLGIFGGKDPTPRPSSRRWRRREGERSPVHDAHVPRGRPRVPQRTAARTSTAHDAKTPGKIMPFLKSNVR